jgi:RNA polymerase sigma-70 factor, ECF subfamily
VWATAAESAPRLDERGLLAALRQGDERAFERLVDTLNPSLVRLARNYVRDPAMAADIAQETWLAVWGGIEQFQGRSALTTWIFRILVNRAKTRAHREQRTLPMSCLTADDHEGPAVDVDRFVRDGSRAGQWATPPRPWSCPEDRLLSLEARERLREAIAELPDSQQLVVTLRDVEGMDTNEVCQALEITPGHARVLLHRGRARLRQSLDEYITSIE